MPEFGLASILCQKPGDYVQGPDSAEEMTKRDRGAPGQTVRTEGK